MFMYINRGIQKIQLQSHTNTLQSYWYNLTSQNLYNNIYIYKYIPAVWEMCLSVDTRNYNMQVLLTEQTLIYEFVIQVLDWIFRLFNKQPHKHTNTWTQMPRKQVLTPAVVVVITSQKVLIGNRSCDQSRCQAALVRASVWTCACEFVCASECASWTICSFAQ